MFDAELNMLIYLHGAKSENFVSWIAMVFKEIYAAGR